MASSRAVSIAAAVASALALVNIATWACYRIDKARAGRGARRIPERVLLGAALAGGSIGALLGVYAHRRRHKAKKVRFMIALWAIVALHAAIAVLAARQLL